ncbi:glycosyltransferase family 2 protein [Plebeiibacterium sediminum]|uniref:Glycosyltransferase family 2 protein n=1 Tax=Plebeiibacterium sediminum TaxID=2992112 RepID=A0AAE3SHA7_9BACT|nr:glycosyltransferase family 2 protein [Plebeiobacterium sediminum]MCW3789196.1 glycosyltransferase family 2 protein [Plebeiobacterium sediminum]
MQQPLISILMTVYNREKYIAQAIQSVLDSSYSNWELIIVDDQSTDKSVEIAYKFEKIDKRINVYVNEKNLGDYPNRNKAASYAKGKYIKYLDSDDLIYPHGLEVMVTSMELFPKAGFGISWHTTKTLIPFPFCVSSRDVYKQQFLGNGFFSIGPTGAIIKREIFEELGKFTEMRYSGDFDSWLKFSAEYDVVVFQPGLHWWRIHEEQEYNLGQDPSKYLKCTTQISLKYLTYIRSPLYNNETKLAIQCLKQRQARMFYSHVLKLNFKYAYKYYINSSITLKSLFKGLKKSKIHFNIWDNL